jgi:hypothetical protein
MHSFKSCLCCAFFSRLPSRHDGGDVKWKVTWSKVPCTRLYLQAATPVWQNFRLVGWHEPIFTSMHAPHLACHIPHQPTSSYLRSHCYVLEDMQVHPSLFSQATRIEDFASSTTTRRRSVRSPCLGRFFWQASSVRIDRHTHSVP